MKNKYIDLIEQSFEFPQEEFKVIENELYFNNVPLMEIIEQYGTPLRISFLPKISRQIQRAKRMFNVAMAKVDYEGDYYYCYCTKSSHFSFVMESALKNDIHLETSSAFDVNLIDALYEQGLVDKERYIICNGFKKELYIENIAGLINNGWVNTIPILDNMAELDVLSRYVTQPCKLGIRIAAEEEPKFDFYTSRLGIRYSDIIPFYEDKIAKDERYSLKMLHFFINTGIRDNSYYWNELAKCVSVYCNLKKTCPDLDSLNIGGGFPIKNSMSFTYDYEYMAEEIIAQIKSICMQNKVPEPNIFSEFGSFTVGESGAVIYQILGQKQQNDRELWYMIDSSFMTTLPDTWAIKQRFILLPVNNWNSEYHRVFLGGLTCDSQDYYNAESHANAIFLPQLDPQDDTPQYIGFFHTGAYQESIGGYGGLQHCLQPGPKHIIIDVDDETGDYFTKLFSKEQTYKSMLKILGY
ncbi:MAG: arginine decarboxylase [Prevotellaceae bacterium]|jgi:arginine decarboxylase|nr:arginine decarboxylase [Prevotellaceae bacterium]